MPDTKKFISKIVKGDNTLWLKDADARQSIADIQSSITGGMHYLGKSTTAIADGASVGPWVIDGVTYLPSGTASDGQKVLNAGDIAIYGELEFIWSGASGKWQEFGSTGSLKALAFKDNASASYTPAGTNQASAVTFTGQTDGNFVTGYNNDAVAPSFVEGSFTPASIQNGFVTPGSAATFQEGAFTPASIQSGFATAGTAASFTEGAFTPATYSHSGFSGGSLGAATTSIFATEGETSEYSENEETLTFAAATTSTAVTAQGSFTPAVYGTDTFTGGSKAADTFTANVPTAIDTTKFSGGSKAADTFNGGTPTAIDTTKFSGGSKAADKFSAGSAATLATAKAITAVGTGEAAAQTFTGTQATITVS